MSELRGLLEAAARIRALEMVLLDSFKQGRVSGTVHTCVGQELVPAALHGHLVPGRDSVFATHRGHGHYAAHGGPEDALIAELMGRAGALCAGRGGSQNLLHERFFSAGIQGSSAPIAVGYAWARRQLGDPSIAVVQLGDGTLGEGALYEAMNFAAWLQVPVLFLVEWNGWAQSTDTSRTSPGDILQRAAGFGVAGERLSDDDPIKLHHRLGDVIDSMRATPAPYLFVVDTRRLLAHSKGDDDRPADLVASLWASDPLSLAMERDASLQQAFDAQQARLGAIADEVNDRERIPADVTGSVLDCRTPISSLAFHADRGIATGATGATGANGERIGEVINATLHRLLADPRVVVLGEDLADPYGGAFKVTKGLSTAHPDRLLSTPIAEAAIMGFSNGAALAGMRPIAEIMFGDFVTLATDQLVNFAAKYATMYGGGVTCPITVRLVSGGGRGYGPTHSQSLERMFCGVPGLRVVALSHRHDADAVLSRSVLDDDAPTVLVEHKSLYATRAPERPPTDLEIASTVEETTQYPPLVYVPKGGRRADVTVVTYGGTAPAVEAAMTELVVEEELAFDYVVLTQLWPLDVRAVVESVRRTGRLVVVEEATADYGVSAAVIAAVAQQSSQPVRCRSVGAVATSIPAVRHLEDGVLPSTAAIVAAINEVQR